ncbi:MAG: VapE domain-containing protein, partial [Slackia sp.]
SYAWECDPSEYPVADADDNVRAFVASVQPAHGARSERVSAKDAPKEGGRNDALYRMACSLQAQEWDDDAIAHAIRTYNADRCEPPLPAAEVDRLIESALSKPKGRSAALSRQADESAGEDPEDVPALTVNDKGFPHQTIENCRRAIMRDRLLDGRIYYDERAYTKMLVGPVPWDDRPGERPVSDADYCGLAAYLERWYWLTSKNKAVDALTLVAMANRRNTVAEWLESLEWDGIERVGTLLSVFLGAEPDAYDAAVMRTFMAGACARACEPGVKFDYMPVLHGPQGIGKSMFLRRLGTRSDWYCDNFNTLDGDAAAEKLRGMWVIEMAELLATKRSKDVEGIKAFITSTVDTIRPKYARETEQRPRTCVFAGTTNNATFLTDATGNRRFLPVACGVYEPAMSLFDEGAPAYFEQAWAEAYARWRSGEWGLVLDRERQAEALAMQSAFTEEDVRIGMIQEYLDICEPNARVCALELIENALHVEGGNPPRKLVNEIHEIMTNCIDGWVPFGQTKARTPYGIQRCYVRDGVPDGNA